jgi:hypothetical protein
MKGPDFSTRPRSQGLSFGDGVLLAAAVLCLAFAARASLSAWGELEDIQKKVEDTRRAADAAKLRVLASHRIPEDETLASQIVLATIAPPPRVLAELTALLPGETRLTDLSLSYGAKVELALHVMARRASAYDLFLKRLSESPRFRDVVPGPENRNGEIQASVRMTYRGAGE